MNKKPIYVTKPVVPELEDFTEGLKEIWHTGSVTNNGKNLVKLEQSICHKLNVPHCIVFNNGTVALLAALSVQPNTVVMKSLRHRSHLQQRLTL